MPDKYDIADPNDPNTLRVPFMRVPQGCEPDPEWLRAHPGWERIPAVMVPRDPQPGESGPQWNVQLGPPGEPAAAPATAPAATPAAPAPEPRSFFAPVGRATEWPVDRHGRPWPRSRFGQPMCPIDELPPGRKPGEAPGPGQSYDVMRDAIAAWRAAEAVFADPGRFAGIVRTAADEQAKPDANVAPSAREQTQPNARPGVEVRLPDGSRIPDPYSATGYVMSPVQDLSPVAAAGRQTGAIYRVLLSSAGNPDLAMIYLYGSLGLSLGHGGTFDYQRSGSFLTGYTQFPQFRDVSNVNVGLFAQQAGLTLDQALDIAGLYAKYFSGNARPDQPNSLDSETAEFIKIGFRKGESGAFGRPGDW